MAITGGGGVDDVTVARPPPPPRLLGDLVDDSGDWYNGVGVGGGSSGGGDARGGGLAEGIRGGTGGVVPGGIGGWLATPSSLLSVGSAVSAATGCSSSAASATPSDDDCAGGGGGYGGDRGCRRKAAAATDAATAATTPGLWAPTAQRHAEAPLAAPAEGRGEPPPRPARGRSVSPLRAGLPRTLRSWFPRLVGAWGGGGGAAPVPTDDDPLSSLSPARRRKDRSMAFPPAGTGERFVPPPVVATPAPAATPAGPPMTAAAAATQPLAATSGADAVTQVTTDATAVADADAAATATSETNTDSDTDGSRGCLSVPPLPRRRIPRSRSAVAPIERDGSGARGGGGCGLVSRGRPTWSVTATAWAAWRSGEPPPAATAAAVGGTHPVPDASAGAAAAPAGGRPLPLLPLRSRGGDRATAVPRTTFRRAPSWPSLPALPTSRSSAGAAAGTAKRGNGSTTLPRSNTAIGGSDGSNGGGSRSWFTSHPSVSAPLSRVPRPSGGSGGNGGGASGRTSLSFSSSPWGGRGIGLRRSLSSQPHPAGTSEAAGASPRSGSTERRLLRHGLHLRGRRVSSEVAPRASSWVGSSATAPPATAATAAAAAAATPFATVTSASELRVLSLGLVERGEDAGGGRRPPRAFRHILENVRVEPPRGGGRS
ncbi:hypothetical protein MMPV_006570 [Pyropia vietnamensis]